MNRSVTMLDLVYEVSQRTNSEAELTTTVARLIDSGTVRLCGSFRGLRLDFGSLLRTGAEVGAAG